jgi:hypothetical protein
MKQIILQKLCEYVPRTVMKNELDFRGGQGARCRGQWGRRQKKLGGNQSGNEKMPKQIKDVKNHFYSSCLQALNLKVPSQELFP